MCPYATGASIIAVAACARVALDGRAPRARDLRILRAALARAWRRKERSVPSIELDAHATALGIARVAVADVVPDDTPVPSPVELPGGASPSGRAHTIRRLSEVLRWLKDGTARAIVWETHPALAVVRVRGGYVTFRSADRSGRRTKTASIDDVRKTVQAACANTLVTCAVIP